jgi:hypothetical protein
MFEIPKPRKETGTSEREVFINNLQTYIDNYVGDGLSGAVALESLFYHPRTILYEDISNIIDAFREDMSIAGYAVSLSGNFLCWRVRNSEENPNG